jgi:hypothetical protein
MFGAISAASVHRHGRLEWNGTSSGGPNGRDEWRGPKKGHRRVTKWTKGTGSVTAPVPLASRDELGHPCWLVNSIGDSRQASRRNSDDGRMFGMHQKSGRDTVEAGRDFESPRPPDHQALRTGRSGESIGLRPAQSRRTTTASPKIRLSGVARPLQRIILWEFRDEDAKASEKVAPLVVLGRFVRSLEVSALLV